MTFLEAKDLFHSAFWSGRNSGKPVTDRFPFGERYSDHEFLLVDFPLNLVDPRPSSSHYVDEYAKAWQDMVEFPPIFVSVGRLLADGKVYPFDKIRIVDGNHRAKSAILCGMTTIRAVIPRSHWETLDV